MTTIRKPAFTAPKKAKDSMVVRLNRIATREVKREHKRTGVSYAGIVSDATMKQLLGSK